MYRPYATSWNCLHAYPVPDQAACLRWEMGDELEGLGGPKEPDLQLDLCIWWCVSSMRCKCCRHPQRTMNIPGSLEVYGAGVALCSTVFLMWRYLFAKKPIPHTVKHGGELVADVLKAHGVPYVFTLVGGHVSPILVAAKQQGIRVIDVRHEVTSVFAADAVARMTGVPGVACVTAGPGLTNTITAVKNAQMAQSPVVLLGGAAATLLQGRGALQDIDQLSLFKPLCKYTASVRRVKDIVPTLRNALQIARSGVPGPVFIEFPINVLYPVGEVRAALGQVDRSRARLIKSEDHGRVLVPSEANTTDVERYLKTLRPDEPVFLTKAASGKKKSVMARITDWYLDRELHKLFDGAWDPQPVSPLHVETPFGSDTDVKKTLALLKNAQRPVLIIGSQATLSGMKKIDELANAAKSLGIPTFLGGMARGLLGAVNDIQCRHGRRNALREADFVLLAGVVCDFRMDYGRHLPRRASIVSVNRSQEDLTKNSDLFWKPSVAVLGDAGDFLVRVAKENASANSVAPSQWDAWLRTLRASDAKKDASNEAMAKEDCCKGRGDKADDVLLNPLAVCEGLEAVLPDNSVLVADGGDFVATASYIVRPRGPLRWLDPGAFGTLGVGGGFALGAKLCRPESEVWIVYGDGSAGYSIAEYDTFVRHNVPVFSIVGNDACWTQIEREQIPIFADDTACPLAYSAYDTVAKGYGGEGLTLQHGQNVQDVLKKAQQLQRETQKPVLVNAIIGKTSFREGSLSV